MSAPQGRIVRSPRGTKKPTPAAEARAEMARQRKFKAEAIKYGARQRQGESKRQRQHVSEMERRRERGLTERAALAKGLVPKGGPAGEPTQARKLPPASTAVKTGRMSRADEAYYKTLGIRVGTPQEQQDRIKFRKKMEERRIETLTKPRPAGTITATLPKSLGKDWKAYGEKYAGKAAPRGRPGVGALLGAAPGAKAQPRPTYGRTPIGADAQGLISDIQGINQEISRIQGMPAPTAEQARAELQPRWDKEAARGKAEAQIDQARQEDITKRMYPLAAAGPPVAAGAPPWPQPGASGGQFPFPLPTESPESRQARIDRLVTEYANKGMAPSPPGPIQGQVAPPAGLGPQAVPPGAAPAMAPAAAPAGTQIDQVRALAAQYVAQGMDPAMADSRAADEISDAAAAAPLPTVPPQPTPPTAPPQPVPATAPPAPAPQAAPAADSDFVTYRGPGPGQPMTPQQSQDYANMMAAMGNVGPGWIGHRMGEIGQAIPGRETGVTPEQNQQLEADPTYANLTKQSYVLQARLQTATFAEKPILQAQLGQNEIMRKARIKEMGFSGDVVPATGTVNVGGQQVSVPNVYAGWDPQQSRRIEVQRQQQTAAGQVSPQIAAMMATGTPPTPQAPAAPPGGAAAGGWRNYLTRVMGGGSPVGAPAPTAAPGLQQIAGMTDPQVAAARAASQQRQQALIPPPPAPGAELTAGGRYEQIPLTPHQQRMKALEARKGEAEVTVAEQATGGLAGGRKVEATKLVGNIPSPITTSIGVFTTSNDLQSRTQATTNAVNTTLAMARTPAERGEISRLMMSQYWYKNLPDTVEQAMATEPTIKRLLTLTAESTIREYVQSLVNIKNLIKQAAQSAPTPAPSGGSAPQRVSGGASGSW